MAAVHVAGKSWKTQHNWLNSSNAVLLIQTSPSFFRTNLSTSGVCRTWALRLVKQQEDALLAGFNRLFIPIGMVTLMLLTLLWHLALAAAKVQAFMLMLLSWEQNCCFFKLILDISISAGSTSKNESELSKKAQGKTKVFFVWFCFF